jgi:hypothetical protein
VVLEKPSAFAISVAVMKRSVAGTAFSVTFLPCRMLRAISVCSGVAAIAAARKTLLIMCASLSSGSRQKPTRFEDTAITAKDVRKYEKTLFDSFRLRFDCTFS